MEEIKILIVDDEVDTLDALQMGLKTNGYQIFTAADRQEALKVLRTEAVDIVVTDLKLGDGSGLDILKKAQERYPDIPVIIITAHGTVDTAVQALREGAVDYVQKPFRMGDLKRLINRLGETITLRRENKRLRQMLKSDAPLSHLVGYTRRFKQIVEFIKQIAPSRSTVLITGETGTGKEVAAEAIHNLSSRSGQPLVKINCGAIPENLLEAELFGYERGAFTGAVRQKRGKIEVAHGGTLFLDEVGELNPTQQVKLLRVLQNGELERLGGTTVILADVRIIAATNVNLEERVARGAFREDLFYRLNVIMLEMPPLRERLEDMPYLAQHFIEKYNRLNNKKVQGIDPQVLKQMMRYPWKGNIRELENMIERAVVLCQGDLLESQHFPVLTAGIGDPHKNISAEVGMSLPEIEKNVIQKTLFYYNYNKSRAAQTLQIGLATLYRKIKQYGLEM